MVAPPQQFLVNFYGLHLRLLLNSYTLQQSLKAAKKGSTVSKSALWQCSSSAIGMLENITKVIGPLKQLYFVQDSVHVMTAYAAIFLIKVGTFIYCQNFINVSQRLKSTTDNDSCSYLFPRICAQISRLNRYRQFSSHPIPSQNSVPHK